MALRSEVFEERVAAVKAAPSGGYCDDLVDHAVCQRSPGSTSGSTRASSPGGDSTQSGDASCGLTSPCSKPTQVDHEVSTLLQRRGIRSAILCELGVDLDVSSLVAPSALPHSVLATPSGTHMGTPFSVASGGFSPTQLIGTRPTLGPRTPAMDASQRSPTISQLSPTQGLGFKPVAQQINSRISRNCLGSSPGGNGDASQRSPAGSLKVSPVSWNSTIDSLTATRPAATIGAGVMLTNGMSTTPVAPLTLAPVSSHSPTSMLGTAGKSPILPARDASCRNGRTSSAVFRMADAISGSASDVAPVVSVTPDGALKQILASSGLAALSSEDIVARLRAAAPAEYED